MDIKNIAAEVLELEGAELLSAAKRLEKSDFEKVVNLIAESVGGSSGENGGVGDFGEGAECESSAAENGESCGGKNDSTNAKNAPKSSVNGESCGNKNTAICGAKNNANGESAANCGSESTTESSPPNPRESSARLVLLGVGKSGLIAQKIAATLSSTGTPSIFIHPTEAMHGDLGAITSADLALPISYSGESSEVLAIMPHLKSRAKATITMTKSRESSLSKMGDFWLDIAVSREVCPLNVAPTSSTTLTLAVGDALAVALMKKRGFGEGDFARFHPGGSLGRRLFVKIKDLMQKENLPIQNASITLREAIIAMSAGKLGSVLLTENGRLVGMLSDGDLRRAMMSQNFSLDAPAIAYATRNPRLCDDENTLAFEVLRIIEEAKIQLLIITDKGGKIRGVVHLHRLVEAGFTRI